MINKLANPSFDWENVSIHDMREIISITDGALTSMLPSQIKELSLVDFSEVYTLGSVTLIEGSLHLQKLPQLRSIDSILVIGGDLYLEDLPELEYMNPNLAINGQVTIINCPKLNVEKANGEKQNGATCGANT